MIVEFRLNGAPPNAQANGTQAPRSVLETGLPFLFLVELTAKILHLRGVLRLNELSNHLKLLVNVIEPLINFMRAEKLCEVSGAAGTNIDNGLSYRLTELGKVRATEWLARNSYSGPAPVTLEAYAAQVEIDSVKRMPVTRASITAAFAGIAINGGVRDLLGAAMNSHQAIYLYGLAGSGKTFIAEHLAVALSGTISVPYAIYVDGEVISIYDPAVHLAADLHSSSIVTRRTKSSPDARWVQSRRPAVLAGGELTLEMLDLKFDPAYRFYHAPPHLKANNGILIIDDLGRQRCSPAELMNRWIVPLDRKIDFLTLHTGHKFEVPFDVIAIFSSNLAPGQLGDASFLRRISYKIHIPPLSESEYEQVFKKSCDEFGIAYCADAFQHLLNTHHYGEVRPLLACVPRDLLSQIRDTGQFDGMEPRLSKAALDRAWNNYFGEPTTITQGSLK